MIIHSPRSLPAVRAGIYTRISYDPAGQRAGVERQRLDCEALCRSRGWDVARYLEDNDRSAYSGKPRRAYQQLLRSVVTGEIDAIVTWHNDRLHRSPKELEGFIDLVERTGVRVVVVSGGDYDLTSLDGRLAARIVGAVARKESEDRSQRVWRKHLALAEQGRPAGQLGWGVRSEEERTLVREAAERVLGGHGLMTIAKDWNRLGVPGTTEQPLDSQDAAKGPPVGRHRRPARARRRPLREGARRAVARRLGGSHRPQDVGSRPIRAAEPRAPHDRRRPDALPADRLDLLRRLRRPHASAPARRPHEALRLRRPPPGPPTRGEDDRQRADRRVSTWRLPEAHLRSRRDG